MEIAATNYIWEFLALRKSLQAKNVKSLKQ
jgi:hypothetical protein